jgi:membrane associated rhomboid family serine protease
MLHPTTSRRAGEGLAPATLALLALVVAAFLLQLFASHAMLRPGGDAPRWAMMTADVAAQARLSSDPALFEPWQPWSHVLVQEGWWQLVASVLGLMAAGVAIEGELGGAALAIACLAVLPLAAAGGVLGGGEPGAGTLVLGLLAVALARRPRVRSRWGVSYYAVTEVGHLHLLSAPLWLLGGLFLVQELARCLVHQAQPPLLAWLGALAGGAALGALSRKLLPPDPTRLD